MNTFKIGICDDDRNEEKFEVELLDSDLLPENCKDIDTISAHVLDLLNKNTKQINLKSFFVTQ